MGSQVPAQAAMRSTRFRDVCGSVDELKRALHEEPERVASNPAELDSLVDDALFMLGRMEARLAEYEAFRERVVSAARALEGLVGPGLDEATASAPRLKALFASGRVLGEDERAAAVAHAEAIRDVAQATENALNRYKELALELERAYREAKGSRRWVVDESEAAAAEEPGEPEWARWLPPSPHRERIVRWLASGRAHLLAAAGGDGGSGGDGGGPPHIQFQDGGVMELPRVRWSDDVRSFYSSERPPDARGRLYRAYEGRRVFPANAAAEAAPPGQVAEATGCEVVSAWSDQPQ